MPNPFEAIATAPYDVPFIMKMRQNQKDLIEAGAEHFGIPQAELVRLALFEFWEREADALAKCHKPGKTY